MYKRMLKTGIALTLCAAAACVPAAMAAFTEQAVDTEQNTHPEMIQVEVLPSEREYYAYMDLETADASLKPYILEARKQIIYSGNGWVADDTDGWVVDADGNVIEEVPHFSDLFPADWEAPKLSGWTEADAEE